MKRIIYFIYMILCTFIIGCDRKDAKYVCTCEQQQKALKFIERSIKHANNMNDEVVNQLWVTGVRLNCSKKVLPIDVYNNIDWSKAEIDSCETAYDWVK